MIGRQSPERVEASPQSHTWSILRVNTKPGLAFKHLTLVWWVLPEGTHMHMCVAVSLGMSSCPACGSSYLCIIV